MAESRQFSAQIPEEMAGRRLDQALSEMFPEFSRSRIKQWIEEGRVRVDERTLRPKDKILGGESVWLEAEVVPDTRFAAQPIPLDIVYEDASIIVINKPAGLVVHPAAGNWQGTLLNALLHHAPELEGVPRAGIVHRLDKDTTGLLVIARTLEAQTALVEQLQARSFTREYEAVVIGVMTGGAVVDAPIGRHPIDRKKTAVVGNGKPAVTHYRVAERFRAHTHITVRLETGRTHQIRVHLSHQRYPLVGDSVYGGRLRLPPQCTDTLRELLAGFSRQALHAARLGLVHPATGEYVEWQAPLPQDLSALLAALREDQRAMGGS